MMKNYLTLTLVCILSFFGCKKADHGVEALSTANLSNIEMSHTNSGEEQSNPCFDFPDSLITLIGTEHNRLCAAIVDDYGENGDYLSAINNVFTSNSYGAITNEQFESTAQLYSEANYEVTVANFLDSVSNPQQRAILREMIDAVESIENLDELQNHLTALKQTANVTLTCYERISTLIALEVCANSANLWFPASAGGWGYYDLLGSFVSTNGGVTSNSITNSEFGPGPKTAKKVARVIVSDAVGAFIGFVRAGLPYFVTGGPVNPISNGVLLTGAVFSGVQSSASTAIAVIGNH